MTPGIGVFVLFRNQKQITRCVLVIGYFFFSKTFIRVWSWYKTDCIQDWFLAAMRQVYIYIHIHGFEETLNPKPGLYKTGTRLVLLPSPYQTSTYLYKLSIALSSYQTARVLATNVDTSVVDMRRWTIELYEAVCSLPDWLSSSLLEEWECLDQPTSGLGGAWILHKVLLHMQVCFWNFTLCMTKLRVLVLCFFSLCRLLYSVL